jgi:hypothetical protein
LGATIVNSFRSFAAASIAATVIRLLLTERDRIRFERFPPYAFSMPMGVTAARATSSAQGKRQSAKELR